MRNKSLGKGLVILLAVAMLFSLTGAQATPNEAADDNDTVEILIGFESAPNPATYNFIEARGWKVTNELEQINVLVVDLPTLPGEADERALERAEEVLVEAPGITKVSFVEENGTMYALGEESWGTKRIGSREVQDESAGEGISVGILDTGIEIDHEALKDNIAGGYAVVESSPSPHYDEPYEDDHGHGTHVAGTAGSVNEKIGVATEVDLYAVKVLDRHGRGSFSDIAEGIIWSADNGMNVINMSLGSSTYSETVHVAVIDADEEGVLQVAAAGNNYLEEDSVVYPAAYEEVIAVSATTVDDEIAEFSSIGEEVELAAPGKDINSAWVGNDYHVGSGTSMAAPHVAGTAALVWTLEDFAAHAQVRAHLQNTAEDIDLAETEQGHGLVDAAAAVGVDVEVAEVTISPSEKEDEAWPEDDAVYEFTVKNTGDVDDTYEISVISNWVFSVQSDSVTLNIGESEVVEVTHIVPEGADAGEHDTGILEVSSDDASDSAEFTTTAKGFAVEIEPGSQEGSGESGDTVEYTYTISNTGTEDDEYDISVEADWEVGVGYEPVSLSAGDSTEVIVSHTIPEGAEEGDEDTGTLTASSDDVSDSAEFTTVVKDISEPEIVTFDVGTRTSGPWNRADVEWKVTHEDGELSEVKSELFDEEGNLLDSETTSVSGKEASGEHNLRTRDDADAVRLTVTDTQGNEVSSTKPVNW